VCVFALCLCVCLCCVCVLVCVRYVRVKKYVNIFKCVRVCVNMCSYLNTYIYIYVYKHVHIQVCMHINVPAVNMVTVEGRLSLYFQYVTHIHL